MYGVYNSWENGDLKGVTKQKASGDWLQCGCLLGIES